MASPVQLVLIIYDLNTWPVSQNEMGNSKCRNLSHQYFCHVTFFLLNAVISRCSGSEDRLSYMHLRHFFTLWTVLQPLFTQILKAKQTNKTNNKKNKPKNSPREL